MRLESCVHHGADVGVRDSAGRSVSTPPPLNQRKQDSDHKLERSNLQCALKTLWKEIVGFNLSYSLEVDPAAGPRESLHYYIYSDQLSWETMRMDSNGVPKAWSRATGTNYWPGFVAWYGLVQLGHYLRGKGPEHLENFLRQVQWLEDHASIRKDGSVVWAMDFDNPENGMVLRAPWVSAHAQGLAISALVRGWRITGRKRTFDLLLRSADVFDTDVSVGGVRNVVGGNTFYNEAPGSAVPGILDGFITSLLGLYDLYVETGDQKTSRLLNEGVEGLKQMLPWWNYRTKWSWYGCREYLCPPMYHTLNRVLLEAIGGALKQPEFTQCAERWNPQSFRPLDRFEIYMGFVVTKNLSRLRHKTWLHRPQHNNTAVEPYASETMSY
jgi:hypothetical protein